MSGRVEVGEDGEPHVRDLDVGEFLAYSRTRDIRKIIERNLDDLPGIYVRDTVARTSMPRGGEREVEGREYLLTLAEALFVAARSETPAGAAVLKKLIAVYLDARRGRPLDVAKLIEAEVARQLPGAVEAALRARSLKETEPDLSAAGRRVLEAMVRAKSPLYRGRGSLRWQVPTGPENGFTHETIMALERRGLIAPSSDHPYEGMFKITDAGRAAVGAVEQHSGAVVRQLRPTKS